MTVKHEVFKFPKYLYRDIQVQNTVEVSTQNNILMQKQEEGQIPRTRDYELEFVLNDASDWKQQWSMITPMHH